MGLAMLALAGRGRYRRRSLVRRRKALLPLLLWLRGPWRRGRAVAAAAGARARCTLLGAPLAALHLERLAVAVHAVAGKRGVEALLHGAQRGSGRTESRNCCGPPPPNQTCPL